MEATPTSTNHQFGGGPDQPNLLYTPQGWNYVARPYQPHRAILDGIYQSPETQPVE